MATQLPADLPTNWEGGQIVAPDGENVGLPKQYGYNYLMEQVNAAHHAVNSLSDGILRAEPFQTYYNGGGN